MIFTAAKMVNSLAILQGFYFAAMGDGNPAWFLFFSVYLYFFSVAEYCEGAFQVRGIHPGPRYFLTRSAFFALVPMILLAIAAQDITPQAMLALLCGVSPQVSYHSGPAHEKSGDRLFLLLMVSSLAAFTALLWTLGPAPAFVAYVTLYALAAVLRGRGLPRGAGVPEGTCLLQLAAVALFVPAPRYMDLLFLQFIDASQANMAAALGFRVVNISVRLPMFIYANYLPPRIASLGMAFRGRPFAIAALAALAAFVICYVAILIMAPEVRPLPLALYALAICTAAYTGEVLRFFASGGTLFKVSLLAPILMVPLFWLLFDLLGMDFDVAFAGCFGLAVVPLVLWAWHSEYLREMRA